MRNARTRQLLVVLACFFAVAMLGAAPAAADVDCADLGTQRAAQSYYQGRTGDVDQLDGDGDGRACEGNVPTHHTDWSLAGLGVLVAAALGGSWVAPRRRPVERDHEAALPLSAVGHKQGLLAAAPTGSLTGLARALRLVSYGERMPLLEEHAHAHDSAPQDVLDALVEETDDLELQRWALVGFGRPARVRLMDCSCVGGLRNFRLGASADGARTWTCASCQASVSHRV